MDKIVGDAGLIKKISEKKIAAGTRSSRLRGEKTHNSDLNVVQMNGKENRDHPKTETDDNTQESKIGRGSNRKAVNLSKRTSE